MRCMTIISYSILLNGAPQDVFYPIGRLCQGHPLSHLFQLCAKELSVLIEHAEARDELHGFKICRKANSISLLFFCR